MSRVAAVVVLAGLVAACQSDGATTVAPKARDLRAAPVVVDGGIPVSGEEGSAIDLSGVTTLDGAGDLYGVQWDFGDGTPATSTTSATTDIATTHAWDDNQDAPYAAWATVSNAAGDVEYVQFAVTVYNVAPTATLQAPATTPAGAAFSLALVNAQDPSAADVAAGFTYEFDCGDGAGFSAPSSGAFVSCAGGSPGVRTVYARITDKDGGASEYDGTVTIVDACTAPSALTLSLPTDPMAAGGAVTITASFDGTADAGTTVQLQWSDGVTSTVTPTSGTVTTSRTFSAAGVYSVTATVSNNCGTVTASGSTYVVVYDPSAGFVTGGGWITAAPGSYTDDPSLTGKATFGFVAKYLKGATVPTGNTEFQFHANGLDFKSTSYDFLVVAGTRAQYKGTGTIKGRAGAFGFLLTAIDGGPGGANDAFRMKIVDEYGNVVFDNRQGSSDSSNDATTLAGGSISIKKN